MEISDSGQKIFQGDGTPAQDVFKNMHDLIALLNKPVSSDSDKAALTSGLAAANGNIDQVLDNVLTVRASVGARLNEIDALDNTGSARDIQYQQNIADLVGLDPVEAYSRLMQQQITLQAAQKAYVSASGLSLFQYM